MGQSWEKWLRVGKIGKKLKKVVKSEKNWEKVEQNGKKWRKVGKTGKSGEKWEKSGEMFSQNGRRRPFWMTENHFRSHFSPFQINAQLLILFLQNESRSVINGCVIYEFDTCIGVAVT